MRSVSFSSKSFDRAALGARFEALWYVAVLYAVGSLVYWVKRLCKV